MHDPTLVHHDRATKSVPRESDDLMADIDAALVQRLLNVPKRELVTGV